MIYEILKNKFKNLVAENDLLKETIEVKARSLTPEEAIGNPTERDYPLIKGRERLMDAQFKGTRGQAFTDMFGDFSGTISDVLNLKLRTNYERAIFISTLNAVMRYLGLLKNTIHCKNDEARECAEKAVKFIKEEFGNPKVLLVGYQPRFAELFSKNFRLKIIDLDNETIGKKINGVVVESEQSTAKNVEWADLLWITGSTIVNDTIGKFLEVKKDKVFYGTTIAGTAYLLNLKRFCALSKWIHSFE